MENERLIERRVPNLAFFSEELVSLSRTVHWTKNRTEWLPQNRNMTLELTNVDTSFGTWIKHRRKALDLTQQELAQRVGCSVSLIFKIESDERRPSRQIAELLAESLEIPLDQRPVFLKVARQEKAADHLDPAAPLSTLPAPPVSQPIQANLPPPLTSLVGREHELRMVIQQIENPACRLLTLTGPGGVGKTRLALEVAHQLNGVFSHGACFVSLVSTSRSELIIPAIADALGFVFSGATELKTQLFNFLKEKQILLILDNLEHLLERIEVLNELLEYALGVKLLTTSREQLNLRSEWIFEVQGLPVPSTTEPEKFESNSATALFVERAKQVQANFATGRPDLQAITRICQLVEGLPLGIELAASWVNTLSCQEIAAELEHNLNFLGTSRRDVPERHRSMHAVFEYSWNLLSAEEQKVLQQLSVFQGGFPREAAAQVAGATLPLLSSLVRKSLIRHVGLGRYDQHELVRQYSAQRLSADSQNEISARDRHAAFYLALWRDHEGPLKSAEQRSALRELIADIDNFRSAWDWAVRQNHFTNLYACLLSFLLVYDLRGWHAPAIRRLESLLSALRSTPAWQRQSAEIYGLAISFQGWFYFRCGQLPEARDHFEQGLALLRPFEESTVLADVLTLFGAVMTSLGESDQALQSVKQGLAAAYASGDSWRIAQAHMMQGAILAGWGQYDQAYTSSQEALARFRALGDPRLTIVTLNTLGFVALQSSRLEEARKYLMESLTLITSAEDPWSAGTAYGNLGIVELMQGNVMEAKALLQLSIPLFADLGMLTDVAHFTIYLGEAALLLEAREEAESHWLDAIHFAQETQTLPTVLAILVRLANLYADRGHIVRAHELAMLVAEHPATWQDAKARAEKLREELEARLTPDQIEATRARVQSMSLDSVVNELMNEHRRIA